MSNMKNILKLAAVVAIFALAGCATTHGVKLTTNTIPVAVPLIYSPAPVAIPRPELPHLTLTPEDGKVDGKVAQAYAASVAALIGYSKELEKELDNYKKINEAYGDLRKKLIEEWKQNTGKDITIADPTIPKTTP
jgi:hypothetical protein